MRTLDSLESGGDEGIDCRRFGWRQEFELRWVNSVFDPLAFSFRNLSGRLPGCFARAPFLNFTDAFAEFFSPLWDGASRDTRKFDQGGFSVPGLSWSISGWFHLRVVRLTLPLANGRMLSGITLSGQ